VANNTDSVQMSTNLSFHDKDRFGIFGYSNYSELKSSSGEVAHIILSDETPAAIATYDLAPVGSLLINTAGGNDTTFFIKEATGATGWAAATTGAGA